MARFCTNCGATLDNDKRFCTECGAPADDGPEAVPTPPPVQPAPPPQGAYQQQAQTRTAVQEPPRVPAMNPYGGDAPPPPGSKYEPITTGGFIGIMLLMCIPIVGQILMIVWAFGGCRKINKRNLARVSLIMFVISLILSFLIGMALKSLFNTVVDIIEEETGINITEITGGSGSAADEDSGLGGLLGLIGGLSGEGGPTNRDIEELEGLVDGLGGEGSGLGGLIDGAIEANKDAEALNDGWPGTLRAYPGGEAEAVASYRTEISGTTLEEMMGWIDCQRRCDFVGLWRNGM